MSRGIPERYRDLAYYGLIFLAVLLFFREAIFTGKNFMAESDNVAFYSFMPYLKAANASGEFPLWVPYIFSGMPSLASFLAAGERSWDFIGQALFTIPRLLGEITGNDTARLGMWYTIYAWGVYSLMRSKHHTRSISLFSSLAAVFSTWVLVWIMIGHSTKPVTLATFPWLLLALERLRERFTLMNVFILALPLIALVSATHPQMMFYFGCGTAIYFAVELISRMMQKQGSTEVLKAGGALVVVTLLALGTHADMFMATRDYTPYSTRGSAPLIQSKTNEQDATGGNDYEYATNWSFSPQEMVTFFVPNYYGFGKTTLDVNGRKGQEANLYWGQMPFTDAANYMGIGVLFLGILGAWTYRKDPFVQFLIVMGVFSLLLSFGKNMPLLYDVFYKLVPTFNKFRAPNMALVLLQFSMPVLAGYGLKTVVGWYTTPTATSKRNGMVFGGICAAFLLVGMVYPSMSEEGYKRDVADSYVEKSRGQYKSADDVSPELLTITFDEMNSDWKATGFIALLVGGLVLLVSRKVIKPEMAIAICTLITVADLWRVAYRPYHPKKGSPQESTFQPTDAVDFLKRDNTPYRIADLSNTVAPNWWAYHFIQNVHGYSSAKMRVYQDMLDVAALGPLRDGETEQDRAGNSSITNPLIWDILNVKYIVANQPLGIQPVLQSGVGQNVYMNASHLGAAWFVDTVKVEPNHRQVLYALRDGTFNPKTTAFVGAPVAQDISRDPAATVRQTQQANQHVAYEVNTAVKSFLVVSQIYYHEWTAYIDGQEVPTSRTDFLLRGLVIPAGKHTVEFKFSSPGFNTGKTISIASNSIVLLVGIAGFFLMRRKGAQPGAIA